MDENLIFDDFKSEKELFDKPETTFDQMVERAGYKADLENLSPNRNESNPDIEKLSPQFQGILRSPGYHQDKEDLLYKLATMEGNLEIRGGALETLNLLPGRPDGEKLAQFTRLAEIFVASDQPQDREMVMPALNHIHELYSKLTTEGQPLTGARPRELSNTLAAAFSVGDAEREEIRSILNLGGENASRLRHETVGGLMRLADGSLTVEDAQGSRRRLENTSLQARTMAVIATEQLYPENAGTNTVRVLEDFNRSRPEKGQAENADIFHLFLVKEVAKQIPDEVRLINFKPLAHSYGYTEDIDKEVDKILQTSLQKDPSNAAWPIADALAEAVIGTGRSNPDGRVKAVETMTAFAQQLNGQDSTRFVWMLTSVVENGVKNMVLELEDPAATAALKGLKEMGPRVKDVDSNWRTEFVRHLREDNKHSLGSVRGHLGLTGKSGLRGPEKELLEIFK